MARTMGDVMSEELARDTHHAGQHGPAHVPERVTVERLKAEHAAEVAEIGTRHAIEVQALKIEIGQLKIEIEAIKRGT